jgi:hypothetical protein
MHVGQALLQDTEKCDLHVSRQSLTRFRDLRLYINPAALGESLDVPLGRGCKSYLVNSGGCSRYDMVRISPMA